MPYAPIDIQIIATDEATPALRTMQQVFRGLLAARARNYMYDLDAVLREVPMDTGVVHGPMS